MRKPTSALNYLHTLDRYKFLTILHTARHNKEYQFIKQACVVWLANYPGDLYVKFLQAQNFMAVGQIDQSVSLLRQVLGQDPQFIEVYPLLVESDSDSVDKQECVSIHHYLTHESPADLPEPEWIQSMWASRQAHAEGDREKAIALINEAMVADPSSALPAILHLKIAFDLQDDAMLANLSEIYLLRWPDCLQINLLKALAELNQGDEAQAVERLNWIAAHDNSGQVIHRLLGDHHRFQSLWPDQQEIYFDLPIPASVSGALGWNQLDNGQEHPDNALTDLVKEPPNPKAIHSTDQTLPDNAEEPDEPKSAPVSAERIPIDNAKAHWATDEDFEDIQAAFSRLARRFKAPELDRADNRFPVYVILSSRDQLETQYGPNTAAIIADLLQELAGLVRQMPEWSAQVFMPDDPVAMAQLGIKPVITSDAWKVKLSLADLDAALARQGEMIGALLIVGGPEIIPYHQLPNPTFDSDLEVPSDNPYATIDENYFIPQWPVGRLPGETGSDVGLLLFQIRSVIHSYKKRSKKGFKHALSINHLRNLFLSAFSMLGFSSRVEPSRGFSAEVWQEASSEVFRRIGKPKKLELCPPVHSGNILLNSRPVPELGYYNLHGIQNGPNWYGQRGFSSEDIGPEYPIALSPSLFNEKSPSPQVVLTEACYGANIVGKSHEESMALKFLDSGTHAFVGSTCTAYGSVTAPLIAADYLADAFWNQLLAGDSVGHALMRSKISFAQEMTNLQGFLDGEDQKTLLSFILFGDPLAMHDGRARAPKPLFRLKLRPALKAISDQDMLTSDQSAQLPDEVTKSLKKTVEKYLPGLHNVQYQVNTIDKGTSSLRGKNRQDDRYLVTLNKSVNEGTELVHTHYARMTFNHKGKLIKLATSR